jgi:hypothetical protein
MRMCCARTCAGGGPSRASPPAAAVYWYAQFDEVRDTVPDYMEVHWRPSYGLRVNCYKIVLTDK